jgi:membrane protein implicated in regulation of membrane protease activity
MENIELWHLLLAGAVASLIIEIFTLGFFAGALGVGLALASVGAAMGLSNEWLLGLFAVGSVVAFFAIKPLVERFTQSTVKTNADSLIGQKGRVLEWDAVLGEGRAMIGGDDWKIDCAEALQVNDRVEVVDRQSIVLIVKKVN